MYSTCMSGSALPEEYHITEGCFALPSGTHASNNGLKRTMPKCTQRWQVESVGCSWFQPDQVHCRLCSWRYGHSLPVGDPSWATTDWALALWTLVKYEVTCTKQIQWMVSCWINTNEPNLDEQHDFPTKYMVRRVLCLGIIYLICMNLNMYYILVWNFYGMY